MPQRANSAGSSVSNGGRRGGGNGGGGAPGGQGGGPQGGQQRRNSGAAPAPQHMQQVTGWLYSCLSAVSSCPRSTRPDVEIAGGVEITGGHVNLPDPASQSPLPSALEGRVRTVPDLA